jgi:ParB/RepB/Spo0J family partition protein
MADPEQMELMELFPDLNLDEIEEQNVALHLIPEAPVKASAELRQSMARRGQLQPVLLNMGDGSGSQFSVVDGRRRIAAARELGLTHVRAYVVAVDALVEASLAVTANAVRGANPVSDLLAIRELAAAGYSEREIAAATGLKLNVIRKRLKLARLDDAIFDGLVAGKVAVSVAERIASMPAAVQTDLVETLAETGKITGDDVQAANSVNVAAAVAGMGDLFADLAESLPAALASDEERVRRQVTDAMRDVLRAYGGAIDLAAWCECAERAWDEETGETGHGRTAAD